MTMQMISNSITMFYKLVLTTYENYNDLIAYFGGYNYYKYGKVLSDKIINDNVNSLSHDVMMCNVIYDLRGLISILPVIEGKCVLEIKDIL